MRNRGKLLALGAVICAFALLCTLAVISPGFDTRQTPKYASNVWTFRDSGQYARINTRTAEIDTVRKAVEPSGLLQSSSSGLLFTQGNSKAHAINSSNPIDIADKQESSAGSDGAESIQPSRTAAVQQLPGGVRETLQAGKYVLLRTAQGKAYAGVIGKKSIQDLRQLNPFATEKKRRDSFAVDAAALSAAGKIALFNAQTHRVHWYDQNKKGFYREEVVPAAIGADAQLTFVGENWVLLSGDAKKLWASWAKEPLKTGAAADAIIQTARDETTQQVVIADSRGLVQLRGNKVKRLVTVNGVPAVPTTVGDSVQAAWVAKNSAVYWAGGKKTLRLPLDDKTEITGTPQPVIHTNGDSAVLTEQKTGISWTLPQGKLIPAKQWELAENPNPEDGMVVVSEVTQQEPPVALPDEFGVRAGSQTSLPVLLNDSDPNRQDILTIVPEVASIPAEFGTLELLGDGQSFTVHPSQQARGTVQFTYRVTDGIDTSAPATVTLRVTPESENTAPDWCPVQGCQREWAAPPITPGGTLQLPVIDSWVDPDGDQFTLESVGVSGAGANDLRVAATSEGKLAVRHLNPAGDDTEALLHITVADSRGERTTKNLPLKIKQSARAQFQNYAETIQASTRTLLDPVTRIIGGSGNYKLVNATVLTGRGDVSVTSSGKLAVQLPKEGIAVVSVTAEDSGTRANITGSIRVTAVTAAQQLAVPPLRAYVQQLADTTVDVLSAIPGSSQQALAVLSAVPNTGGLRADVLENANIRVSGSTADGGPGKIGTVALTIAAGEKQMQGELTVFQVAAQPVAIAMPDVVTVRAGNIADIPVLANDVSSPGTRLILHPNVSGSGQADELAFASGNILRYRAPKTPGSYTLQYTSYVANAPEVSDVGTVRVTVLPQQGNRNPEPAPLTVRVSAGETASVNVPEFGIDPDGDRVRLVGVTASKNSQVSAQIAERSAAVTVVAGDSAKPGLSQLRYTVRDSFGAEGEGVINVFVTAAKESARVPVAYSDYVRLVTDTKDAATVRPLNNDIDPAGGKLKLVSVEPLTLPGEGAQRVAQLASRLDKSHLARGEIRIASTDHPETISYRYTVQSSVTGNTADGLIVVQTSARVGPTAPAIRDTVLTVADRSTLETGGIDVVSGRVSWSGGDPDSLQLSLQGESAKRYTVRGNRISGKYDARGDTVVLRFTGTDTAGEKVESYAFLIIPSLDELRLSLKPSAVIRVKEEGSAGANLTDLVALGDGDRAEFQTGTLQNFRSQGKCEARDANTIRYVAGSEQPWTDTCTVYVKLTEQRVWTRLAVPVLISPRQPQAELQPLLRTIKPGAVETVDLTEMVRWRGGRAGSLAGSTFNIGGVQGSASAAQNAGQGNLLKVSVHADAVSGSDIHIPVVLTGEQRASANLTIRVGIALPDNPRGGTVQLSCRVGDECSAPLTGIIGEYDPFKGAEKAGLRLRDVTASSCEAGKLQKNGERVTVSWPDGAAGPGGKCTATFTVADAQGRTGTGQIELDAKGVPRAPTSLTAIRADGDSVVVSVQLSAEASYPAVTGVELVEGGTNAGSCELNGMVARCVVSGLVPGERHTYQARAVNEIGSSQLSSGSVTTWAYRPPAPPKLSVQTVEWPNNTNPNVGRVKINLVHAAGGAANSVLLVDNQEVQLRGDEIYELPAGPHTISAYGVDNPAAVPPGYEATSEPAKETVTTKVIGAPTAGSVRLTLSGANNTDWAVEMTGFHTASDDPLAWEVRIGDYTGANTRGSGLAPFKLYRASVRAYNSYGSTLAVMSNEEYAGPSKLWQLAGEYSLSRQATSNNGYTASWEYQNNVRWNPQPLTGAQVTYSPITPEHPSAQDVRQCLADGSHCSDLGTLVPAAGSIKPFNLTWNSTEQCMPATTDTDVLASYFKMVGEPGIQLIFSVEQNRDIAIRWADTGEQATVFSNRICGDTAG